MQIEEEISFNTETGPQLLSHLTAGAFHTAWGSVLLAFFPSSFASASSQIFLVPGQWNLLGSLHST